MIFYMVAIHSGNNSGKYVDYLTRKFEDVKTSEQALNKLNEIRQDLLNGRMQINNAK